MIEINWRPTDRQLRQFAVVACFAIPFIAWIWGSDLTIVTLGLAAGLALLVTSWFLPLAVLPIFIGMSIIAAPIGIVLGEFALLLVYFIVLTPVGLLLRMTKRNVLQLNFDKSVDTYWQKKKRPQAVASYFRQF